MSFLLTFTSAYADDWSEKCDSYTQLAEAIMKARQSGVSMAKLMKTVKKKDGGDFVVQLIIDAYDTPRYSSEKMQQETIENFRDNNYLECVKALRNKN